MSTDRGELNTVDRILREEELCDRFDDAWRGGGGPRAEDFLRSAGMEPGDIDIISTHATSTPQGDIQECKAVHEVFGGQPDVFVNNTKSFIGHAMGAAGALELAGNLPSLADGVVHPTINLDQLDPECAVRNLVANTPKDVGRVDTLLNMSFGMLGINSAVVVGSCRA